MILASAEMSCGVSKLLCAAGAGCGGEECRLQTVADEVEGRLEMDGGAVAEDTVDIIYSWPSGRRRKFADVDGDMVGRACTRAGEARGAAEPDST